MYDTGSQTICDRKGLSSSSLLSFIKVHFSPFANILEVIGGITALPKRFDFVMFAPRRKTHVE
jgi:hypothetical protein